MKKLSRLELLELLLEASKENKKLKEEIDRLRFESKTTQNIENLSMITTQVESALKYANSLTDTLKITSNENTSSNVSTNNDKSVMNHQANTKSDSLSDVDIYRRMLRFFAKNDDKLSVFPADIENDVRARIRSIIERRKSN